MPGLPGTLKAHFVHVALQHRIEVAEVHHGVHDRPVAADLPQSWKASRRARALAFAAAAAIVPG